MQNRNNASNKKLHSKRALWQRIVASVLCVCLVVPMLNGVDLTWKMPSKSNIASAATAEEEKAARKAEYEMKFDMADLKWNESTDDGKLNYGGSMRNYLDWRTKNTSFCGITQRNYIHVFAFEGDTICFGSNIDKSELDISGDTLVSTNKALQDEIDAKLGAGATADIVLIDLQGNRIPFDVITNGAGHIPNVQTEVLAKTMESMAGNSGINKSGTEFTYTPLTYKVKETGVYTFEFHSTDKNDTNGQGTRNEEDFYKGTPPAGVTANESQGMLVAAWDISVFNEMDQKETGRVYADYLSLQNQGNTIETYYVLTADSYIYRWDWNGNAPYTYGFFTDNRGLIDNVTGDTIYKSVKNIDNNGEDYTKFGAEYKYPTSINTETSKTFSIFFEMPNTDLEGYMYSKALQPDPAQDIKFIDMVSIKDETDPSKYVDVPGAYEGAGGYFSFKTGEATTATLTLDFTKLKGKDGKPVSESYAPVSISRSVTPHSINYFYWDGKDGNGVVIPAGKYDISDVLTITTKAGEIHFPVTDMETASKGFTITRVSPIYDKNGKQLDTEGSILDATKSVIYYDDSAIYYGETIGKSYKKTQADIEDEKLDRVLRDYYKDKGSLKDDLTGKANSVYFRYNNVKPGVNGNEYYIRSQCKDYVGGITALNDGVTGFTAEDFIRIGDHSHTTNTIEYYDEEGNFREKSSLIDKEKQMIEYLDSEKHPVGVTNSNAETSVTVDGVQEFYYGSISDYGLVNYWTFIPSVPEKIDSKIGTIDIIEGDSFNLYCQVFFDNRIDGKTNGYYDQMQDEDTLLSGITLRLYRKTTDTSPETGKTYYKIGTSSTKVNDSDTITRPRDTITEELNSASITNPKESGLYELYREAVTTIGGYVFSNIPYNDGDEFVYEVVRPNNSYVLTSGQQLGKSQIIGSKNHTIGNNYILYNYDTTACGTEVQVITVGTSGIDPNLKSDASANDTRTISAIDVGYNYTTYKTVTLQKTWETAVSTEETPVPVFELSYVDNGNNTHIYEERPLAKIDKLSYSYPLLSDSIGGNKIKDWFVSAEYYIKDKVLYKQVFEYSPEAGDYSSFVGKCYQKTLEDTSRDGAVDQFDIPDTNEDGVNDWSDLAGITDWIESTDSKYHAVLDRILGTQEINISITNSEDPGIIEVLKYTGALEDKNYLQGATFRVYTNSDTEDPLTLEMVQAKIDSGKNEDLQWLADHQVGSSTTRTNGRVTFAGLDTKKHYIVREMYAPAGYRLMEALYMVHPYNCTEHELDTGASEVETEKWKMQNFKFDENGYVRADIANIPANGDMAIRKQIVGRAWNNLDSFSFDLAFWNESGSKLNFSSGTYNYPGAIEISEDELTILKASGGETTFSANLKAFIEAINNSKDDVVVNYLSDFAKNVISINGTKDIEESLVDTKQSVSLVVNDDERDDKGNLIEEHPDDAILNTSKDTTTPLEHQIQNSHPFPAAGTYTFTIKENVPDNTGTMRYTGRVYTLVVEVTRMPIDGVVDGTTLNLSNSYLRAEVSQIYYQDPTTDSAVYPENYGPKQIYAGVAPTFTNEYYVQPAKQSTSYAIEKQFSGRMDEDGNLLKDWLESDKFTIKIEGADDITKEALLNGNIFIGGLKEEAPYSETKTLVFKNDGVYDSKDKLLSKVDENHLFRFDELDFRNLAFPVEWVFTDKVPTGSKAGDVVPKSENENENVVLYLDEANAKECGVDVGSYFVENASAELTESNLYPVISRTQDIVYTLMISEENGSIAGVEYDETKYKMVITLKNALNAITSAGGLAEAVTDGIIDEIEVKLFSVDGTTGKETEQAYCKTDQHVVTDFDAWSKAEEYFDRLSIEKLEESNTVEYAVYYVTAGGEIREAQITETGGSKKYEVFYSGTLHEITASNFETYIANGVTFIIKREEHSATNTHAMPFKNTYTETAKWTPKITKTINGRSWLETDSFTFTIEATSWPGYDGEHETGDYKLHEPKITDKDIDVAYADLTTGGTTAEAAMSEIEFNAPGLYTFTVTESSELTGGIRINYGEVELTVTVKSNNDGTLSVTEVKATDLTTTGETDITSPFIDGTPENVVLKFVNTYSETGKFHLYLTKTLKGRTWTDEEFTFAVTPDPDTLKAINSGQLKVPESWGGIKDGKYTVTIKKDDDNSTDVTEDLGTTPWTTRKLDLGELTVTTEGTAGAKYGFTITEEKTDSNLDCAQPSINLQINAISNGMSAGVLTFTATYATVGTDLPTATPTSEITLPFTNADTRLGTITVKKTVRDQPAGEKFTFTLKLTKPSSNLVLELSELEITLNGKAYTQTWITSEDGNSFTLTFELGNGESLVIENVPYGTGYEVTENVIDGFHLQEVKDGKNNALDLSFDGKGVIGSVSTDNKDVVLEFVNSRFYDMPFTGGAGVHPWVILGIMLMVLPPTVYLFYRKRRNKEFAKSFKK